MSRYLVTGGAGFIGSNLVHALVARGEDVRVLDDFSTGRESNLAGLEGKIEMLRGSVADRTAVDEAMRGVDFVLHHAAIASVPQSVADPRGTTYTNLIGTLNVLEGARQSGVKRVVYAASSSAYGDTTSFPHVETMPPMPTTPYAASKLAGEHYCRAFTRSYGLETVALRYFNIFGPRQDPASQYAAVIPRFIAAALAGRPPVIYGDGWQSRDFCYVGNVVAANIMACAKPGPVGPVFPVEGETFNIGSGESVTLRQLLRLLSEIMGRPLDPVFEPARLGEAQHSQADIYRATHALGYYVRHNLVDGLRQTVEWMRSNA